MTNSLSSQTLKVMNFILKPYEKNSSEQFSDLLSQVPSREERVFLCLLSIMLGSPNCINHSLIYISYLINKKKGSKSVSNEKSIKTDQDTKQKSNPQLTSNLAIMAPKDILNSLSPEMITSFWINLSFFYRSKKDNSSSHIHLASLVDIIPTFYNEKVLKSLLTPKNCSFLVINYIQKIKDNDLLELSEQIIENCPTEQIKLFIPFVVSNESSSKVIETWITQHICENYNIQYEIALTAALSSYQCVQLAPTTIDLILINFFSGQFSVNSEIFESFLFYIQRTICLFDRNKFSSKEDFLMTFFSSFIKIRPNLFKGSIVCPNMFTKMITNKIRIPPFSLSLYFPHLDDFLLKYISKQFIISKSYLTYMKYCYEKTIKINRNSFSRKVLDYSIMALFLKTTDPNSTQYPIVVEMAGKMKMPRDEFANLVFMQICRMFSNQNQRIEALNIIENWKKDDLSKITKLLLFVFNTKNINALVNVEEIICKRGGHALTALFNLASTQEFCNNKARKTLLIAVIEKIVSKINVAKLKPRNYMQNQLFDLINENLTYNGQSTEVLTVAPPRSPPRSPSKTRLRSRSRKENDDVVDEMELFSPSKAKSRSRPRTVSTTDLKETLKQFSPPKQKPKSRIRTKNEIDSTTNKNDSAKDTGSINKNDLNVNQSCCLLTNDQLAKFLIAQISNKNSNRVEIQEIVRQIIKRIESLDRRHSKHHHSKSNRTNPHKHSKENESTKKEEDNDEPKKEDYKEETKKTNSPKKDEQQQQEQEKIEIKEEEKSTGKEIINNTKKEELNDEQIELNDDQIELNDENKTNENSGFYNVVGSVMKMLFGFGSSQSTNNDETKNKPSFRSSLPIQPKKTEEANSSKVNDDGIEKKIPVPSLNNLESAKTTPLFDEEIEISSEGVMAFPDEDYSSSSSGDYSDIDISSFDLEISDNEIPML